MNASPTWMQIGLLSGVVAGVIGVSIFLVGPPAAEKKPLRSEVATLDASNATVDRVVVGGIASLVRHFKPRFAAKRRSRTC